MAGWNIGAVNVSVTPPLALRMVYCLRMLPPSKIAV
jgi:hypothetical protein